MVRQRFSKHTVAKLHKEQIDCSYDTNLLFSFSSSKMPLTMADKTRSQLISDLMMLELDRQLAADRSLWPNIQGLYVLNITKRRKPKTAWYGDINHPSLPAQLQPNDNFAHYIWAGIFFSKVCLCEWVNKIPRILTRNSLRQCKGNDIKPLVTSNEQVARKAAKRKPRVVKIWIEDTDVLNFITGGYVDSDIF